MPHLPPPPNHHHHPNMKQPPFTTLLSSKTTTIVTHHPFPSPTPKALTTFNHRHHPKPTTKTLNHHANHTHHLQTFGLPTYHQTLAAIHYSHKKRGKKVREEIAGEKKPKENRSCRRPLPHAVGGGLVLASPSRCRWSSFSLAPLPPLPLVPLSQLCFHLVRIKMT